jgi:hemerythrin-like metal-binding protein
LEYARKHFKAEEEVLRLAQYPDLAGQEHAHQAYIQKLGQLTRQYRFDSDMLSQNLLLFLKEWWLNHIQKMDKSYADYLPKEP